MLNNENTAKKINNDSSLLGYQIDHYKEACQNAVNQGYKLVVNTRKVGVDIRIWCVKTLEKTKGMIQELSAMEDGIIPNSQDRLLDISEHERDVRQKIKEYIDATDRISDQFKQLNPPLTNEQLEPFWNAFNDDKQQSILAMDSFSPFMEELSRRKNHLLNYPH